MNNIHCGVGLKKKMFSYSSKKISKCEDLWRKSPAAVSPNGLGLIVCLISVNTEVSKLFFKLFEAVFLRTERCHTIAAICRRSFRSPDVDLNQMKSSLKCQRCIVVRHV